MLPLTPSAASELIQDVISSSINSHIVPKKGASKFEGKIGKSVSSDLLTLEDDGVNINGLGSSSFDREGVPHRHNIIIENGILKKFIYNTYTANKREYRKVLATQEVPQIHRLWYQLLILSSNQENQNWRI